jgi:hypothetical protein
MLLSGQKALPAAERTRSPPERLPMLIRVSICRPDFLRKTPSSRPSRPARSLRLEHLEDRLAPTVYAAPDSYAVQAGQVLSVPGGQRILAQSGFNDQEGINSDPIPDSPYRLGDTIVGRGLSEPGWAGAWYVSDGGSSTGQELGQAETDPVYEGDGALHIRVSQTFHETWVHRQWAEPQFDQFLLEQRVRLPDNGVIGSRPYATGIVNGFGPYWRTANNHFLVLDGDGNHGGTWLDTGFTIRPLSWQTISLVVNVAQQTWEFFVDGQQFISAGPLHFRDSPGSIQNVDYLADTDVWLDSVRMIALGDNPVDGVLSNDISPGGNPLSAWLVSSPEHGTLSFGSNGGFRYIPDEGFTGDDTFTYQASDGALESNVATVTIHVTAGASPPPPSSGGPSSVASLLVPREPGLGTIPIFRRADDPTPAPVGGAEVRPSASEGSSTKPEHAPSSRFSGLVLRRGAVGHDHLFTHGTQAEWDGEMEADLAEPG